MSEYYKGKILVVDDELSMRELLELVLSREEYEVSLADCGKNALSLINDTAYDLLLCDLKLGDITGIDVLKHAKKKNVNTVVIMISAYATTETAVEAMNSGAYDFIPKPFNINELKQTVKKALKQKTIDQDKRELDLEVEKNLYFGNLIGNSPPMQKVYGMIEMVSKNRTNVLITGESGTGKELIARSIHQTSDRNDQPFVAINCGGIPENLIESELFGYKKGAFTGAATDKKGLFVKAHNGTIFLDEIGELSLSLQVKLLRVIQERIVNPVGSTEEIAVDIRIISATNKNLEEEVIHERFREDLFYRLNVIQIKVPPLRKRKQDLPLIAQYFLEKYSKEMDKSIKKISSYAFDLLKDYNFPGNIRELENLIERSVALSQTNIILPENLSLSIHKKKLSDDENTVAVRDLNSLDEVETGVNLEEILENIERKYIIKALECTGGGKKKAAELLSLSFRSFRYRVKKLDIT